MYWRKREKGKKRPRFQWGLVLPPLRRLPILLLPLPPRLPPPSTDVLRSVRWRYERVAGRALPQHAQPASRPARHPQGDQPSASGVNAENGRRVPRFGAALLVIDWFAPSLPCGLKMCLFVFLAAKLGDILMEHITPSLHICFYRGNDE